MRELNTEVTRTIEAPAETVWSYRLDFLHLPEYNADVEGHRVHQPGRSVHVGATCRFRPGDRRPLHARRAPGHRGRPRRVVAIDMDGAIRASERFTLTPDPPTGCHVAVTLTMFFPDQFPPSSDAALLANGEAQIAGRARLHRANCVGAPVGGGDHG